MIQVDQVEKISNAKLITKSSGITIYHLLLDSRKIISPAKSIFFAISGVRHDGHKYIPYLYSKGVRHFIVDKNANTATDFYPEATIWESEHVIGDLHKIVAYHREQFNIPIIGITGSNGKTIVKEWLSNLLGKEHRVIKSPKSYNSQIGVPLSVWEINEMHTIGIFEAGISLPGEMDNLEKIISPTIGIFTTLGSSHDEGFNSRMEKAQEKCKLFKHCQRVIYCKDYFEIDTALSALPCEKISWSTTGNAYFNCKINTQSTFTEIQILQSNTKSNFSFTIPFTDKASIENSIHCIVTLLVLSVKASQIQAGINGLTPIAMRLEIKEGIHGSSLIDDTYNNDLTGLKIALNFMDQKNQYKNKTVILSDLLEIGLDENTTYHQVADLLIEKNISHFIGIGPTIHKHKHLFNKTSSTLYTDTENFLETLSKNVLTNQLILIKGARKFKFERIVKALQQKVHDTFLEINLDAVAHNLNFYRSKLLPTTKIMVMVKALAYGAGSIEVANLLQFHRVDYLAVAYADEGVTLRENGITLPIMVMNPSPESFELLLKYTLEPEIYSLTIAKNYLEFAKRNNAQTKIHIKLDTGMRRLGFEEGDIQTLTSLLLENKNCKVASIFTHLAGADEEVHDEFTKEQLVKFEKGASEIETVIGYKPLKHALNSAGIIRFTENQMDMVRLGIGLYGVETGELFQKELEPIGTLKAVISQIKQVKKGESIGYSRKSIALQDATIATISIGYADGYDRRFSNGVGKVLVNGTSCPIIGNVCMDMCMVNITDAKANEGDEVIIFGKDLSVIDMAKSIGTIPYEILTGISERVKRVFYTE